MTVQEARIWGASQLKKSETPLLDALLILGKILQSTHEELFLKQNPLSDLEIREFKKLITLRATGFPVAYIRGTKEFYGREFMVTPSVLIPRPDTEILIEAAINLLETVQKPKILDLCTGSGCIGITMQAELTESSVTCVDLSPEALEICKQNSISLLGKPIHTIESNLFTGISQTFDAILTNPPYLTDKESNEIQQKGWNEPDMAFRAGSDGLDLIREIIRQAPNYLSSSGYLVIEAADLQAKSIANLMTQSGFIDILHHTDLSGEYRVTSGKLQN